MKVTDCCRREVYHVSRDEPLAEAARGMHERRVGAVIVSEMRDGKPVPIGIVTDRDVVLGQLARKADLFCLNVGDVMTPDPVVVPESSGVTEAIRTMTARSVRRAPVVDSKGNLTGVVTLDDLVPVLAEQLANLGMIMRRQANDPSSRPRDGVH